MGLIKGTILAGMGLAGWVLEETFGYLGAVIASQLGLNMPPEIGMAVACGAGIVLGDVVTLFAGNEVNTGKKVGIVKGLVASLSVLLGVVLAEGYVLLVLSIWLPTVLLDYAGY